jgi:hypothetical protein
MANKQRSQKMNEEMSEALGEVTMEEMTIMALVSALRDRGKEKQRPQIIGSQQRERTLPPKLITQKFLNDYKNT